MIEDFEKELIKTGKLSEQSLRILKSIIKARADFKKGKLNPVILMKQIHLGFYVLLKKKKITKR